MRIRREDFQIIVEHAKSEVPYEACGALLGRKGEEKTVERVVKAKNILKSSVEYQIAAEEVLEIFKLAELLGVEVLGFYHSHPFHGPFWSATDDERSKLWVGYLFLIFSPKTSEARCYLRVDEDRVEEEPINIV